MSWRLLQRVGAVLALALALIVLASDAGEYPGLSRAGLRALSRGVLPLAVVAGLNLAALDERRPALHLALAANIVFLGWMLRFARAGAPPFVWMSIAVAALLVIAAGMRLSRRTRATGRDAE